MLSFNSSLFLFLILPLSSAVTLLMREKGKAYYLIFISILSCVFYHFMDNSLLALLVGSALFNYFCIKKHIRLIFSVSINLGLLLVFKYLKDDLTTLNAIPLGVSFFILQQISALVDTKKKKTKDKDKPLGQNLTLSEYLTFVTMYPQLIAGPIIRLEGFIDQIRSKRIYETFDFRTGSLFIIMGLFKKVVIADSIAAFIFPELTLWSSGQLETTPHTLTHNALYGFMVYFDFSGYSEMAVGIAHFMGFKLPMNFDSPFKRSTIADFWRHWHITIHNFMIDYFFRPFVKYLRPIPALFMTFFFISVWHGSSTNFLLFGLYHALIVVMSKITPFKLPRSLGVPFTTLLFSLSGIFFHGRQNFKGLITDFIEQITSINMKTFISYDFLVFVIICSFLYLAPNTYNYVRDKKFNISNPKLEALFFGFIAFVVAVFMDRSRGYVYFEF